MIGSWRAYILSNNMSMNMNYTDSHFALDCGYFFLDHFLCLLAEVITIEEGEDIPVT